MGKLQDDLRGLFGNRLVHKLTPAALLASASGVALAGLAVSPAESVKAGGIILGGLAINFSSSLLEQLVSLPLEDAEERERLIEQGLSEGDPGVQRLVAAAALTAGPEVAAALPEAARAELADRLGQAMQASGGPLATIARPYAAALRSPHTDWAALQAALLPQVLTVSQEIRGVKLVEDARQEAHDVVGTLKQSIEGETVCGATQLASGVGPMAPAAAAPARPCPDCGALLAPGVAACPRCGLPLARPAAAKPAAHGAEAGRLTIRFAPAAGGATLTWSGASIGERTSSFVHPFAGEDLELVLRALDGLQHLTAGLTAAQAERLTALQIPHEQGLVADTAHPAVGRLLYRALTADPRAAQALSTARDVATGAGAALSLALHFPPDAVTLAALPWELLWAEGEPTPLLLSRGPVGSLTRHLGLAQALPPPRAGARPLRVRAIVAHAGLTAGQRAAERAARLAVWQSLAEQGAIELLPEVSPATREAVLAAPDGGPIDILHLVAHGAFAGGEGQLVLDGPGGGWARTPISQLAPALAAQVRLALLSACQGAMVGAAESTVGVLGGVAPALIAHGVPMVVAMQLTVRQPAASRASGAIYAALAAGQSVQAAVAQARLALYTVEDDRASWYVPTLYLRARDEGPARLLAGGEASVSS